jgi:hypothetical protein
MMGATLLVPQSAHADTAQNYKTGATVLGVLGVVLAAKGKALPAIIAGAGAYYAYEKGKDAENDYRYDSRYNGYNWNDNGNDNRYDRNDYRYRSNDYYGRYDNDRNDNRDSYDNRDDSNNYYRNHYDNNNYDRYDRNYNQ